MVVLVAYGCRISMGGFEGHKNSKGVSHLCKYSLDIQKNENKNIWILLTNYTLGKHVGDTEGLCTFEMENYDF